MGAEIKDFLEQVVEQGVITPNLVKGKKVLIIAKAQSTQPMIQVLYKYMEQAKAAVLDKLLLFHASVMDSYLSIQDIPRAVGDIEYDLVILLEGLEKEESFQEAADILQSVCRKDGYLIVLARTPYETGTRVCLEFYEDAWRYEPQDIQTLFWQCEIERAILSDPAYMLAMRLRKMEKNQSLEYLSGYSLFHCVVGHRITREAAKGLGFFRKQKQLDAIGVQCHTDKCSYDHNYLDKYEFFLKDWKQETFNLLELGVYMGSSERMWKEYFPHAQIYGVDIDPGCHVYEEERIHIIEADLAKKDELDKLQLIQPRIIVDDASHFWSHQILALFTLFDALPSGGIYILEDLETSTHAEQFPQCQDAELSAYEVCSRIAQVTVGKRPCLEAPFAKEITRLGMAIEMMSILKGSCIMIKR